jgi:rubrerythrin
MAGAMSSYAFFEKAVQLEMLAADIYRTLGAQFQADPEARDLFRQLAEEEVQHAQRVKLLATRYQHDSRLFEDAAPAMASFDALLDEGRAILEQIERGSWSASLEVVKGELADLEERFSVAHAHVIAKAADPALRSFFERMVAQDVAHRRLLRP